MDRQQSASLAEKARKLKVLSQNDPAGRLCIQAYRASGTGLLENYFRIARYLSINNYCDGQFPQADFPLLISR